MNQMQVHYNWGSSRDPRDRLPWSVSAADAFEDKLPDVETVQEQEFDDEPIARIATTSSARVPIARSKARRFQLLTLEDIERLPPPQWLIEGLVPAGALAVLYGPPKLGKSFVALDWALSVAAGRPWLGRKVAKGGVVYVYAEGLSGLPPRVVAWREGHGGVKPTGFHVLPHAVAMPSRTDRRQFIEAIGKVEPAPALIVLDTLARNFGGGDENSQKDMSAFVAAVDELREAFPGATVLVVHHSGKDDGKGLRGSSALEAAADTVLRLKRVKGGLLELATEDQKDAAPAQAILLRLVELSLPYGRSSCVVQLSEDALLRGRPRDPRAVRTDQHVLRVIESFGADGVRASDAQRMAKLKNISNGAFYESLKRLTTQGLVRKEAGRYFATTAEEGDTGSLQLQDTPLALQDGVPPHSDNLLQQPPL